MAIIKSNIILIGMPNSGKSTIGQKLAGDLAMNFVDTDILIRNRENRELKEIVNTDGLKRFLDIQESVILALDLHNHVIATGGGAVYSEASMLHLKESGTIVYLETPFEDIESRLTEQRRFARNEGQSLRDVYNERLPLYRKYADITVNCAGRNVGDIAGEIEKSLKERGKDDVV